MHFCGAGRKCRSRRRCCVVQIIGSARLLRRHIRVKSAGALERLAEIDTVVFDETGTRALPAPRLRDAADSAAPAAAS
jgi:Cu2+-exporting ATPase